MGSSVSVHVCRNDDAIFVNKSLIDTEAVLKHSDALRSHFVKFISEKKWTNSLSSFEDSSNTSYNKSTWGRFGYKSPHCSGTRSTEGTKANRNELEQCTTPTSRSPSYSRLSVIEMANEKEDLLPILIAALLPVFLGECEGAKTVDIWTACSEVERFESLAKPSAVSEPPGRLARWLLNVTDMFTADQLDDYLADGNRSFTSDYKNALTNLPVRITLCTIDAAQQRSPIAYSNDAELRTIIEGLDLHELYSEDCSPGGVIQVSSAIFGAKKYKRSLTNTDGQCRLRAMKPVFNSFGRHVYTLGVESMLFEDPILQSRHTEVSERPFHQIEDMLLLLPMLIKAPHNAQ